MKSLPFPSPSLFRLIFPLFFPILSIENPLKLGTANAMHSRNLLKLINLERI